MWAWLEVGVVGVVRGRCCGRGQGIVGEVRGRCCGRGWR